MSDESPETLDGAGGLRLAATRTGRGRVVLLLPGGGQTRHSWDRSARQLAASGYCAVAVDLRGHGDSDWSPNGAYGLPDYADDVRVLLDRLGPVAGIVGASLGGATAMMALGNDPSGGIGLADCLVLVNVTPRLERGGVSRVRNFMTSAPQGFASLEEAADAISKYRGGQPTPRSLAGLAKNLRRRSDERYYWHWDPNVMNGFHEDESVRHAMLVAAARGVKVSTQLVRGAESDVVGEEGRRELATLIPDVHYAEVDGAGHMVAGDNNEHFSADVVRFVREHSAAPG